MGKRKTRPLAGGGFGRLWLWRLGDRLGLGYLTDGFGQGEVELFVNAVAEDGLTLYRDGVELPLGQGELAVLARQQVLVGDGVLDGDDGGRRLEVVGALFQDCLVNPQHVPKVPLVLTAGVGQGVAGLGFLVVVGEGLAGVDQPLQQGALRIGGADGCQYEGVSAGEVIGQGNLRPAVRLAVDERGIVHQVHRGGELDGYDGIAHTLEELGGCGHSVARRGGHSVEGQAFVRHPYAVLDTDVEACGAVLDGCQDLDVPCLEVAVLDAEAKDVVGSFALFVDVSTDMEELTALDPIEEGGELLTADCDSDFVATHGLSPVVSCCFARQGTS